MLRFVRQFAVRTIAFAMVLAMASGPLNAVATVASSVERASIAHQHVGDHHGDASSNPDPVCTAAGAGCGTADHHHDQGTASGEECCAMACHSFVEATYLSTFVPTAVTSSLLIRVPTGTLGSSSARLERPPRSVRANG